MHASHKKNAVSSLKEKKAMHEVSKFITNFKDSEAMRLFPSVSHL